VTASEVVRENRRQSDDKRARAAKLQVSSLSVRFRVGPRGRGGTVSAVTDASFTLRPGRLLALVGESGCGKSVLAAAIMGLLPANAEVAGRVDLDGLDLLDAPEPRLRDEVRGRRIGLVPQSAATHLTPVRRVGSQLVETVRVLRPEDRDPLATVHRLAADVGLPPEMLDRYPHELSGGTAQRVGVAAALAGDPPVLLADEPTAGLDRPLVDRTVDLLADMAVRGHAVLLITHDLRAARRVATDVAVMYASRLVEIGPAQDVFTDAWHPYTRGLLGALPDRGFAPVPGHPPDLTALPPGCGFSRRRPDLHSCVPEPRLVWHGDRAIACAPVSDGVAR
jgi:peptide/nickel transport system ATP-binding protein